MTTRVLIIEDDAAMRESLAELLSMEDIQCDLAEDGVRGLAMVQAKKPHLIVLDVLLPDISGFQLCQLFKKDPALRRVPVVMVSGRFTQPEDRVQGLELGADEHFVKPFDPVLFVARIKNLLRSYGHAN